MQKVIHWNLGTSTCTWLSNSPHFPLFPSCKSHFNAIGWKQHGSLSSMIVKYRFIYIFRNGDKINYVFFHVNNESMSIIPFLIMYLMPTDICHANRCLTFFFYHKQYLYMEKIYKVLRLVKYEQSHSGHHLKSFCKQFSSWSRILFSWNWALLMQVKKHGLLELVHKDIF